MEFNEDLNIVRENLLYSLSAIRAGLDIRYTGTVDVSPVYQIFEFKDKIIKNSSLSKEKEYDLKYPSIRTSFGSYMKCLRVLYFLNDPAILLKITDENKEQFLRLVINAVNSGEYRLDYVHFVTEKPIYECASTIFTGTTFDILSKSFGDIYKHRSVRFCDSSAREEIDLAFIKSQFGYSREHMAEHYFKLANKNFNKLCDILNTRVADGDIYLFNPYNYTVIGISVRALYGDRLFNFLKELNFPVGEHEMDAILKYSSFKEDCDCVESSRVIFRMLIQLIYDEYRFNVNSFLALKLMHIKDEKLHLEIQDGFPYVDLSLYKCDTLYEYGLVGDIVTKKRNPLANVTFELDELQKHTIRCLSHILGLSVPKVYEIYKECGYNSIWTYDYIVKNNITKSIFKLVGTMKSVLVGEDNEKAKIALDNEMEDCKTFCDNNDKDKLITALKGLTQKDLPVDVLNQINTFALSVMQSNNINSSNIKDNIIKLYSIIKGNMIHANKLYDMDKFNASQGHGFAAEYANNFADRMRFKNAKIVGDDNAKNGADRLVNGRYIQTKYYRSGSDCVNACFSKGVFRYYTPDGKPMAIEVPKGMYQDAVSVLELRIRNGEVPGVTDPSEAKNIILEGSYTYKQAVNIAKAGNIDSIKFDAENATVTAVCALGLSAVISFGVSFIKGEDRNTAIDNAIRTGISVGKTTVIVSFLSSQISKSDVRKLFMGSADSIVKLLGKDASSKLVNGLRHNKSKIYGCAASKNASKIVRNNMITALVTVAVLSAKDISDIVSSRISTKQLIRNITTTTVSVGGGTVASMYTSTIGAGVGATVGTAICPGIGTVIGSILGGAISGLAGGVAGGAVSGAVVDSVFSAFTESDAEQMLAIIKTELCRLATDYLLSKEEATLVAAELQFRLNGDILKDMFANEYKYSFANAIIEPICVGVCKQRPHICMPSDEEINKGIIRVLNTM